MANLFRTARQSGTVDLSGLDGLNGFRLAGGSAATGDVNGDGTLDIAAGTFILYGGPASGQLDISGADMDGTNGFRVGLETVLVDLNHDGFTDIVGDSGWPYLPEPSWVLYGRASFNADEPVARDPPLVTEIDNTVASKWSPAKNEDNAWYASLGDFNGDGYVDLGIAAYEQFLYPQRFPQDDGLSIVTGGAGWQSRDLISGADGHLISGGSFIFPLGDIDGDGKGDLGFQDRTRQGPQGQALTNWKWSILFGSATTTIASVTLSQGTSGLPQPGPAQWDRTALRPMGRIGDVNGDGTDDLLLQTGATRYVLFGGPTLDTAADPAALDGTTGFRLPRLSEPDPTGVEHPTGQGSVAGGDFNGDGFSDIAVGDDKADDSHGTVYVFWGRAQFGGELSIASTDPQSYIRITNPNLDYLGGALHAADVDGDGIDDLLAETGSPLTSSQTYVVLGASSISLTANADTWYGTGGSDEVDGLGGDDSIYGQAGDDRLLGNAGDDHLWGGLGADVLDGGAGYDFVRFDDAGYAGFTVSFLDFAQNTGPAAGDEYLYTEGIVLASGNDIAYGDSQANILRGMGGDDTLLGGGGADALEGGDGSDTASYANAPARVTVALFAPSLNAGDAAGDTFDSIEALVLSSHDDLGYGSNANDTVQGGLGRDALYGQDGDDSVDGGADHDLLWGGLGSDVLDGGDGFDYVRYDDATFPGMTVALFAPELNTGAAAGDTYANIEGLILGFFDDLGYGSNNADYIYGINGNDSLYGQGGDDNVFGGEGHDLLWGGLGADFLDGGDGFDYARYDDATFPSLTASLLDPSINTGAAAGDTYANLEGLILGFFDDTGHGSDNADYLYGINGNDTLHGHGGNDNLYGGIGNDTFVFDSAPGAGNVDTIGDFLVGADQIQLENAVFASLASTGALDAGKFRSGAGVTTAADADDFLIYDTMTGFLYYDADGNGSASAAVQLATVSGTPGLTAVDFVVT